MEPFVKDRSLNFTPYTNVKMLNVKNKTKIAVIQYRKTFFSFRVVKEFPPIKANQENIKTQCGRCDYLSKL